MQVCYSFLCSYFLYINGILQSEGNFAASLKQDKHAPATSNNNPWGTTTSKQESLFEMMVKQSNKTNSLLEKLYTKLDNLAPTPAPDTPRKKTKENKETTLSAKFQVCSIVFFLSSLLFFSLLFVLLPSLLLSFALLCSALFSSPLLSSPHLTSPLLSSPLLPSSPTERHCL